MKEEISLAGWDLTVTMPRCIKFDVAEKVHSISADNKNSDLNMRF